MTPAAPHVLNLQDSWIVAEHFMGRAETLLFGVFDGHGESVFSSPSRAFCGDSSVDVSAFQNRNMSEGCLRSSKRAPKPI